MSACYPMYTIVTLLPLAMYTLKKRVVTPVPGFIELVSN